MSTPATPPVPFGSAALLGESKMTKPQQKTARSKKIWTKKPTNNADEGKVYERLVVAATLLTLTDGQEMICEMEEAGKFDDLVVRVENDGYYLAQIKHKQNGKSTIREKGFFWSGSFIALNSYIPSFQEKICKNPPFKENISLIKELVLITNVDFNSSAKKYVEEVSNSSREERAPLDPKKQSKRYRFKQSEFSKIKSKLGLSNSDDIDVFLAKLVLVVNFPSIRDLQVFIKENVRSLIPIKLNEIEAEQVSQIFQEKVKTFFDKLPKNNETWANVSLRQTILLEILLQLKETVQIGATVNYVGTTLEPILENIFVDYPHEIEQKLGNFLDPNKGLEVLNIIVPPERSFPVLASCKLKQFCSLKHVDRNQLWMVDVKAEKDGVNLAKIFTHSNVEVFKDYVFVVEFSQETCTNGVCSRVVEQIFDCIKDSVAKLPKFIFITSQALNHTTNVGSFLEIVDHLSIRDITKNARTHLSQKTFLLHNGPSTSLGKLGIDVASLNSLSLSELLLADKNSQVDLCLPLYDPLVEETYIGRKLKLPALDVASINDDLRNHLIRFDRGDSDGEFERDPQINLLRNLETFSIPHGNGENLFLLTTLHRNSAIFGDSRIFLEKSLTYVEVTEDVLLTDSAVFDSSSDVKAAIVVDLPGMGKSSLLTHLCNTVSDQLRSEGAKKLVVRVNLGSCGPETWGTPLKDEADLIDFLMTHSQSNVDKEAKDSNPIMTNLSKEILREIFNEKLSWRVVVLLDGFDEISPTGRQFVLNELISLLTSKSGVDRIIVTSRPYGSVHKELEDFFKKFALHLSVLDSNEQKSLLASYFSCYRYKSIIKDNPFDSVDKSQISEQCNAFASELVSIANYPTEDDGGTILDIPVQCILLAECCKKDLIAYISGNSFSTGATANFDLLSLYDKFLEAKFDILFSEKEMNRVQNDKGKEEYEKSKNSLIKKAMRVSVYYMTRDKEKAEHLLGKKWNAKKFLKYMQGAKDLGLVAHFNESTPEDEKITSFELVHRTFAEYLLAKYLIDTFKQPKLVLDNDHPSNCRATYEIVLEICLVNDGYAGVRKFLTRMVHPLLPDFQFGCPFEVLNRENVVTKWPLMSHDKFNDFLADHIIKSKESMLHLYHRLFGGDGDSNYALYVHLTAWLYLCLKEHIVRNLAAGHTTDSFLQVLADDVLKVIVHLREKKVLFNNTDSKSTYEQVFTYLLFWTLPSSETDEEAILEVKDKVFSVLEEYVGSQQLSNGDDLLRAMSAFAAVKFLITRQLGFKLGEQDLCKIFQYVCNSNNHGNNCLMSSLIFSSLQWSDKCLLERESQLVSALCLEVRNKGKYSVNTLSNFQTVCFKEILEMGSPDYWDGNTCLLQLQISWFLSLSPPNSTAYYRQSNDLTSSFLVICVDYLLSSTYRFIRDNNEADAIKRRVVRQALKLNARISKWLNHTWLTGSPGTRFHREQI